MASAKAKQTTSLARDIERPAEIQPPTPHRGRVALLAVAFVYIVTVWFDGIGTNLRFVPRVWLYFSQVAALFKEAGRASIAYRAEGWSCADHKWSEIDVLPYFPLDAENKENRFHRVLQFYRQDRRVMRPLEDYVMSRYNAAPGHGTIAGVRFVSLRIPYPKIGDHVERIGRRPLAEYPPEQRHDWYWTPMSRRREHCGEPAPPQAPKEAPKDSASGSPEGGFSPKEKDEDDKAPSWKEPE